MHYLVYGVALRSDVRLPELVEHQAAGGTRADITIRLAHPPGVVPGILEVVQTKSHEDGTPWIEIARTASGYLISEVGVADFAVDRHGREVVLYRVGTGVSELTIRHLLLDWVLALVLNLRGKQVLHASAVVTPRGLFALAGPSGTGKSTLAASFASAGYPVLCDDCLIIERNDEAGCFECTPAYPGLRLWDDSVEALGLRQRITQSVAGYMPKHRVAVPEHVYLAAGGPPALVRFYCLSRVREGLGSKAPSIEPLAGSSALVELISRSWLCDPTDRAAVVSRFRFFESLAKRVHVKKLHIPDSIALLPQVRNAVLADLASDQDAAVGRSSAQASPC